MAMMGCAFVPPLTLAVSQGGSGAIPVLRSRRPCTVAHTKRVRVTVSCCEQELSDEQELASIDRMASSWIGSSISRWEWYERIKLRRARLRRHVERQERELTTQMDELRTALLTLDALLGIGLIEKPDDRISVLGWMLVLSISVANFVVAYAIFELFSNLFYGAFPIHFF